jgi:N-acetylmuramic acid 6-phosphate etherase
MNRIDNAEPLPDRSHIVTEQRNPGSTGLHRLDPAGIVAVMVSEQQAVDAAFAAAAPAISAFVSAIEDGFWRGGRLVYLGAGTSGRLAVLDASEIPPTFCLPPERIIGLIAGGDGSLRASSEGREDETDGALPELERLGLGPDDAVLGIAAGGTTPYVRGAVEWAARLPRPPVTGLLTCAPCALPTGCGHLLLLATGPEILTGSTRLKAGTATKLALNAISTALMVRGGLVYDNLMVNVRASNVKLRDRAARIVGALTDGDREAALRRLDAAGGAVAVAVVMFRRGCDRAAAAALLVAAGGRLAAVIDD